MFNFKTNSQILNSEVWFCFFLPFRVCITTGELARGELRGPSKPASYRLRATIRCFSSILQFGLCDLAGELPLSLLTEPRGDLDSSIVPFAFRYLCFSGLDICMSTSPPRMGETLGAYRLPPPPRPPPRLCGYSWGSGSCSGSCSCC